MLSLLSKSGIAIVALWLLIWLAAGDSIAYLGYINALGFLFALFALFAAIILLVLRRWIWAAAGLGMALILIFIGIGMNFGAGPGIAKPDNSIRVISASLRGLNKDMQSAASRLASYDAEIITVQEVSNAAALKMELEKIAGRPYFIATDGPYSILSVFPVSHAETDAKGWSGAAIAYKGRSLQIWNIHAPKAYSRPVENSVYFAELIDALRARQPDIIAGDFNASPWNQGYRLVSREMNEAHSEAGFGSGNSFPARGRRVGLLGAFTRIDHIFVTPRHKVVNAFTGKASQGADHHPVVADIVFAER